MWMNIFIFDYAGILAKKKQQMHATFATNDGPGQIWGGGFFCFAKKCLTFVYYVKSLTPIS